MHTATCFRIDYPSWSYGEGQAPTFLSENEPLGLFFGPTDPKRSGLRVLVANDAEQIEVHLDSRASLLRPEPDYFGEPTNPAADSPLHRVQGQVLRCIFVGECVGPAGNLLTTAIRLEFERDTLTFHNAADEGRYFVGEHPELWQAYTDVYPVKWRNYSQWLRLLSTEVSGLPYQLV